LTAVPAVPPVNGDLVSFASTGQANLDGKEYRVANWNAGAKTFELSGFDGATKLTAAVAAVGTAQFFHSSDVADAGSLLCACFATITVNGQAPDTLNLDDMCTATTVLGSPKPPTFSFTGWVDKDSPGFQNLIQASLENPKTLRYALFDFGTAGGYIFGPVEIGEVSVTAGVNAGLAFSGSGVFTEVPTYSWAL
jgi:hypothetical protein